MTKRTLLTFAGVVSFGAVAACTTGSETEEAYSEGSNALSGAAAFALLDTQGAYTPEDVEEWCTARNEGEGADERLTLRTGVDGPEGFYPCSRRDLRNAYARASSQPITVVIPRQEAFTVTQRCNQWCWATGDQMISKALGIERDQTFFVKKIYGSVTCAPASALEQMSGALSGRYEDAAGNGSPRCSQVSASVRDGFPTDIDGMVRSLQAQRPFLFAHRGHVWTAYGLSYTDGTAGKKLVQIELIDPWPSSPRYQTFTVGTSRWSPPGGTIRVESVSSCTP
jgi:hypothetical protein